MRQDYRPLPDSERRRVSNAELLGPANDEEPVIVSIVLRRRLDGPPPPDPGDFLIAPSLRPRLTPEEFAATWGASPDELDRVVRFVDEHELTRIDVRADRRTVVAAGTVAQMSRAFGVPLERYRLGEEIYRGYTGSVYVPGELAEIIIAVVGLQTRRISKRNSLASIGDPPDTNWLSVAEVTKLYDFPPDGAAGQTIAIFSGDGNGYARANIDANFPQNEPLALIDIPINASNSGEDPGETTQDIVIAAQAAPGAAIAVYFTNGDEWGWLEAINRVVHPSAHDPRCSVMSSSYYFSEGDDCATLEEEGIPVCWVRAISLTFADAALHGITMCVASGDTGSCSCVNLAAGHPRVQYPASDPWVLTAGGTTIGNVKGSDFDEYSWQDSTGTTGGGVSALFNLPRYQQNACVPKSLADGKSGRGMPDVAANASRNSGYKIYLAGGEGENYFIGAGTSAAAPLWAGLIAVINAARGENVGFVNPALYKLDPGAFRDIVSPPGPSSNEYSSMVRGYPVTAGWDACTGWGSPKGTALLAALDRLYRSLG